MSRLLSRFHPAALALALFAIVLGAKWAMIDRFGTSLPDWDQWDAEALGVIEPWFEGREFARSLFEAHNEHRVVITKLQTLGLTLLNGQWDARVQTAVNAILHSLIAVGLWLASRRWIAPRWHAATFVLIALLFALPLAWQNLMGGFHSQQYWLMGLSMIVIFVWPWTKPWRAGWWLALLTAVLVLGSMGSGLLAAAAVIPVVLFRWFRREIGLREAWPTLAFATLITAVGWFTRVEVNYHASLVARGPADFFLSTVRSLAWPIWQNDRAAALLWLPWVLLGWRLVRDPAAGRGAQSIFALGGWVLLQILAAAYARGAEGAYPASRYMDTLALGCAANGLALFWLLSPPDPARPRGRLAAAAFGVLAVAWTGVLWWGLRAQTDRNFNGDLPQLREYYAGGERNVRRYLYTGDPAALQPPHIPYPSAEALIERLRRPAVRAVLPAVIRPPLTLPVASLGGFRANAPAPDARSPVEPAGLGPGTPPLPHLANWGSYHEGGATAEWRSQPLTGTGRGWLVFETAGDLGEPGVALELRDARTDDVLARVVPARVPRESWRTAYVRTPDRPFVVVAGDTDPERWLGFSAPIEMGSLSYLARDAVEQGAVILLVAAGAPAGIGLLVLAASLRRRAGDGRTGVRLAWLAAPVALAGIGLALFWSRAARHPHPPFILEAHVASSAEGRLQAYFDRGQSYVETDSAATTVRYSLGVERYRLPVTAGPLHAIRLDPIDQPGRVVLGQVRLLTRRGETVRTFANSEIKPVRHIAEVQPRGGWLEIVTEPDANDPQLELKLEPPLTLEAHPGRDTLVDAWHCAIELLLGPRLAAGE